MPQQARVQVSHKGIKRLSSSNELGAQYVSPHQTTIKRKKTTPESREPAWYLCHDMMQCSCNVAAVARKEFLVVPNDLTLREKQITGVPGTSGAAGILEKGAKPKG